MIQFFDVTSRIEPSVQMQLQLLQQVSIVNDTHGKVGLSRHPRVDKSANDTRYHVFRVAITCSDWLVEHDGDNASRLL